MIILFYRLLLCKILEAEGRLNHAKNELIEMNKNLNHIPMGNYDITTLNVAYNNIEELVPFTFWNNSYKNLRKLHLDHNRVKNVSLDAFKGLSELRMIDLSDNNLTTLDPYQFEHNIKLNKVVIVNNKITFYKTQPFLMSDSIDTLILTNNCITQVYEITFVGVPNLKRLYLNDNNLSILTTHSFKKLIKLSFLSLSNTKVHHLSESMFNTIPKIIDLEDTPVAKTFNPPLSRINKTSIIELFRMLEL